MVGEKSNKTSTCRRKKEKSRLRGGNIQMERNIHSKRNKIDTRTQTKSTKTKKKTSDWDVRMALPPVGCTNKIRKKSNKQHKIAIVSNFPVQRSRKWSQLAPSSSIQHLVNKFQKKLIHIICFEKRKTNSEDGST